MTATLGSTPSRAPPSSPWARGGRGALRTSSGRRKWLWGYGSSCTTPHPLPALLCHHWGRTEQAPGNGAQPIRQRDTALRGGCRLPAAGTRPDVQSWIRAQNYSIELLQCIVRQPLVMQHFLCAPLASFSISFSMPEQEYQACACLFVQVQCSSEEKFHPIKNFINDILA